MVRIDTELSPDTVAPALATTGATGVKGVARGGERVLCGGEGRRLQGEVRLVEVPAELPAVWLLEQPFSLAAP